MLEGGAKLDGKTPVGDEDKSDHRPSSAAHTIVARHAGAGRRAHILTNRYCNARGF
jgi:hypothetical protein